MWPISDLTLWRQYDAKRELAQSGYAPMLLVQELEERVTSLTYDRRVQMDEVSKAEGQMAMIGRDIAAAKENFSAAAAGELSEAESIIATRSELLAKAERREVLQTPWMASCRKCPSPRSDRSPSPDRR